MTDRKAHNDDPGLDMFFAAARARTPEASEDFLARITAQALVEQPQPKAASAAVVPAFWAQLKAAIGGWPGIAGLATASAAGLWIGISPPDGLSTLWLTDAAGIESLDLDPLTEFDFAMMEG